jgi:hypothetical protein
LTTLAGGKVFIESGKATQLRWLDKIAGLQLETLSKIFQVPLFVSVL